MPAREKGSKSLEYLHMAWQTGEHTLYCGSKEGRTNGPSKGMESIQWKGDIHSKIWGSNKATSRQSLESNRTLQWPVCTHQHNKQMPTYAWRNLPHRQKGVTWKRISMLTQITTKDGKYCKQHRWKSTTFWESKKGRGTKRDDGQVTTLLQNPNYCASSPTVRNAGTRQICTVTPIYVNAV